MSGTISGTSATTFGYTGTIVQATVATTGTYYIVAVGAKGGDVLRTEQSKFTPSPGGFGAEIGGEFSLTANETLSILVGNSGSGSFQGGGGGGGGTFVVGPGTTPLVVAGGGGGAAGASPGGPGLPLLGGAAGPNEPAGGGGLADSITSGAFAGGGGGGGGLIGNGASASSENGGAGGGMSFTNGGAGDRPAGSGGVGGFGGGGGGGGGQTSGPGGGGGGGYDGGTGELFEGGSGGYSFDGGRDTLLTDATFPDFSGSVVITPLFASTITLSGSGQTIATGATPVTPFAGVSIIDPDGANPANAKGPTETVTVTPSATTTGTLADPNHATDASITSSSTGAITLSGSAASVAADLAALSFTPASGPPSETSFTIADTNWSGLTSTSVTAYVAVAAPSVITVPAADQVQPRTSIAVPFAGVTITDPDGTNPLNSGASETVTVTPSSRAGGLLSDPSHFVDGSILGSNGSITYTQTASAVTSWLDQLTFTPFGNPSTTNFTITDTNWTGLTTTTSGISVLTNESSSISGTQASQATTDQSSVKPFANVTINDPNGATATDTAEIFLGNVQGGGSSDADGLLSGAGLLKTGAGSYVLAGSSPATLSAELNALVFTPTANQVSAGQSVTTGFTIVDFNPFSSIPAVDSTTSVVATAVGSPPILGKGAPPPVASVASTITVPAADQAQTSIGLSLVKPFAGVTIADSNAGSPTETVTVTPSTTTVGTLSDPNRATDGSGMSISTGAITFSGSATTVTADLDALTFTPGYGQSGQTSFSIADQNSAGQTTTPLGAAAVTISLPTVTAAQLQGIGKDVLQFYTDELTSTHITAGASKLASDFKALDLSQAEVSHLLGQALIAATLGQAAATTLGADIAGLYYPKVAADVTGGNGVGLGTDLSKMVVTTVGASTDYLLRGFSGQSASQALAGTVSDLSKSA